MQQFEVSINFVMQQPPEALLSPSLKQGTIGILIDLMGLALVVPDNTVFVQFWNWLYPKYTPFLSRLCDACYSDSAVMIPLLKLIAELLLNRADRLQFEASSPNGLLLFRETGRMLSGYINKLVALPRNITNPYTEIYKPSLYCLEAVPTHHNNN